jgi:hypothetical protein
VPASVGRPLVGAEAWSDGSGRSLESVERAARDRFGQRALRRLYRKWR